MEIESIEFYKWEKQKALIVKYNTADPYSEIYFENSAPFQQITESGCSSSDFDIFEETKYDFIINCPRICKEYKIVVSKFEIKKLLLKNLKSYLIFFLILKTLMKKQKLGLIKLYIRI